MNAHIFITDIFYHSLLHQNFHFSDVAKQIVQKFHHFTYTFTLETLIAAQFHHVYVHPTFFNIDRCCQAPESSHYQFLLRRQIYDRNPHFQYINYAAHSNI